MKTSSLLLSTDHLEELVERLLPVCLPLRLRELVVTAQDVTLGLICDQSVATCPLCGEPSRRVHSHDSRTLLRLREALLSAGWALGGQAGARQCAAQGMPVSGTTLLSLLRHWGSVARATPRVLGVDNWSFQARLSGTLLVDLERHQPVEVLLGSDEPVLADWLLSHAGVAIIVRDRGSSYLKGAAKGAPQAQQVLDRWHLLKNLGEVIQKTLAQQIDLIRQAGKPGETAQPAEGSDSASVR